MKIKHTVFIFVIGFLLSIVGVLFKITHWHIAGISGNMILIFSSVIEVMGGLLFLYKLFTRDTSKDFLNS